jgi:hypothetical protein
LFATICAGSAWAAMLLNDAARGPVNAVGDRFGGILGIPSIALIAITILFSALLAWTASCVGATVRKALFRKTAEFVEPGPVERERATPREVVVADA